MGFWKEFFSDLDEPAITIIREKRIVMPISKVNEDRKMRELAEENSRLRKQLKMSSVETEYRLIE